MSLASTYDGKVRVINDILSKTSPDERKIMLQLLIKMDMKAYFEVIWEEQKRLEDEAGVKGVCEYTSDKVWVDGEEQPFGSEVQSGLEVNLAGKVSKEAENAYYLDEKIAKKHATLAARNSEANATRTELGTMHLITSPHWPLR